MDLQTEHAGADPPDLLEASWTGRDRVVEGRELRLELLMTAAFGAAVVVLLALSPFSMPVHPAAVFVVIAYAIAARAEFPIGSGHVVPTQLFLVPLFALAPAPIVPVLAFAGLAVGLLGDVLLGRSRPDRLVYCGGDAMHALGPAVVLTAFAGGDLFAASPEIWLLAFAAQLAFDFGSSTLHDLLVFGTKPEIHVKVLLWVWGVDAGLAPIGVLAAEATQLTPWAGLAPLPLVALLSAMAADRNRRIGHAVERLDALNRERARREAAVQRVGDALASDLDLEAVLQLVGRAATEALDGVSGRAIEVREQSRMTEVERSALRSAPEPSQAEEAGLHVIAGVIGDAPRPIGVLSVARATAFSDEERSLLVYLCGQAAISAAKVASHELLRDAEARLRHQAFHDGLTELANRALFAERVAQALDRRQADGDRTAVLFVDLDGFKLVNDALGHEAGDELLVVTARRIIGCIREGDTAARLGGDEFALLLEDLESRAQAETVAHRLRNALRAPIRVRDREFVVRASIGVAFPEPGTPPDSLLRRADLAMYAAKSRGGDRVALFHAEMLARADMRTELANDLRIAVHRGEIELDFQPIVDLADGRPLAVEALARWRHPRRGLLAPEAFIPLAERTGMIGELGRVILDDACRIAAGWPGRPGAEPKVCVNVSPAQLRLETFAGQVTAALERHGLPASRLVLEVTESVAMASDAETQSTLRALRAIGVGLALDDFGTGYSSLGYLARTKVDLLKLDRAFLAGVENDAVQARLVAGVIQLAGSLGVPVVAEGIERPAQLARLRELGGNLGQGFLIGRPVDADALALWLSEEGESPAPTGPQLKLAS